MWPKLPKLSGSLFTWWAGTFLARHKPGKLIFYKRWSHSKHMQTICLSSQCHGGCSAVQQDPPSQRAAAQAPVPPQLSPRRPAAQAQATRQHATRQPSTFQSGASTAKCVLALACKYTIWHHGLLIHSHCQESCCRNWSGVQECLVGPWYLQVNKSWAALVKNVSCCHAIILTTQENWAAPCKRLSATASALTVSAPLS